MAVLIDRRYRRIEYLCFRQVIKTCDDHIFGNADPVIFKGRDHDHGDLVVGADKGIGELAFIGKVPCDLCSLSKLPVRVNHVFVGESQAVTEGGISYRFHTFCGIAVIGGPGNEDDILNAVLCDKMAG